MKCPICGHFGNELLRREGGLSESSTFGVGRFECRKCDFIYSDFIDPEVLKLFYNTLSRARTPENIAEIRSQARENGESQLQTLKPFIRTKIGRVLDFGGGYGEAAKLYLPFSDEVYIVEEDESCHKVIAENSNLKLLTSSELDQKKYIGYFDLIIFSNVLEHMTQPMHQIQKFSRILSGEGTLFIEVPCEAEMLKKSGVHGRQHVGFYNVKNFQLLIENQGSFDVLDIRRCGASVNEIMKTRSHTHDYARQYTPDGYEIRAVLRNQRPKAEFLDMTYDREDKKAIMNSLSNGLFRFAQDFHLQRNDRGNYEEKKMRHGLIEDH